MKLPLVLIIGIALQAPILGAEAQYSPGTPASKATPGDALLTGYFRIEIASLKERSPMGSDSSAPWIRQRESYREQLQQMLGLSPMPERTDLKPVVTGTLEAEEFTVDKLQFQASPGLYCTANLYLPKGLDRPAPTILYECGHWKYITNGISCGNKAVYQIDGAWYARNGYACLVLDTLLAGEIQGIHTGTRDNGLWWWNSRGYTPAGVEAWFGIRALDYLSTRPEVDTNRLGITGHSGGGAYSWTVTALDDRIKVAAPLAGMTDISHHILHNLMDRHCDCNFPINTYRWDFPQLAAMAAPRPLLIGGTDNDGLFPLESTVSIYDKVRGLYNSMNASDKLGLIIAPGPHDEVPELRLAVMRWFNRYLKGIERASEPSILMEVKGFFLPEQLRVFETLPDDAINAHIADSFVPRSNPDQRSGELLRLALKEDVFAGWPHSPVALDLERKFSAEREGVRFSAWDFTSQHDVPLRLYLLSQVNEALSNRIALHVLDEASWLSWLAVYGSAFPDELLEECLLMPAFEASPDSFNALKQQLSKGAGIQAFIAPRGVGLTAWSGDTKRKTRIRRRFMLLGQTVDGMRVWDICRTVQALEALKIGKSIQVDLRASGMMAVDSLYAALFEPSITRLQLSDMPRSHIDGPDYLNVLKVTDIPEVIHAVEMNTEIVFEAK